MCVSLALVGAWLRERLVYHISLMANKCVHVLFHRRRRGLQPSGRLGPRPGRFEWGNLNGSKKRYTTRSGRDSLRCTVPIIQLIEPVCVKPHDCCCQLHILHGDGTSFLLFLYLLSCSSALIVTGAEKLFGFMPWATLLDISDCTHIHRKSAACSQMKPNALFLKWMSPRFLTCQHFFKWSMMCFLALPPSVQRSYHTSSSSSNKKWGQIHQWMVGEREYCTNTACCVGLSPSQAWP